MQPQPVTVGLMLANQVIIERITLNPSIIGTFTGLGVDEFPTDPQQFSVWSTLTHGMGSGRIELRVFSLRNRQQIYAQRGSIHFPDLTEVVYASFPVRTIRFPHPGYFLFRLFIDDSAVPQAMCRLRVYRSQVAE